MARRSRPSRRGFGSIRRLPSGRYQASYTGPDTVRHKAPYTFDAKVDAEEWLVAQRATISGEEWTPPAAKKPQAVTVAEYADAWMAERELKPRTRYHYRWLLNSFIVPTFGPLLVKAVTPAAVRTWHAKLDTGPTARAHAYALLRSIMATAVDDELVAANPCRIRGASKVQRINEIRPATLDELTVLTEHMPARLQLIVPLAAWCALRFGEVTELRRQDVDTKKGVVRVLRGVSSAGGQRYVDTPKTRAGRRDVSIPPHLIPMIKQHLHDHAQIGSAGLLFYGRAGGQLPHSTLLYHFNRATEAAARPDLTPHTLRHTGSVLAAQSGATLAELMARLGHTTPAMAMRYQHAAEERDLLLAQKLSALAQQSH